MKKPKTLPSLWTTTEIAASELGISVQRVRQLIREMGIEPVKVGNAIIISSKDFRKLEQRNTKSGRPKKAKK